MKDAFVHRQLKENVADTPGGLDKFPGKRFYVYQLAQGGAQNGKLKQKGRGALVHGGAHILCTKSYRNSLD